MPNESFEAAEAELIAAGVMVDTGRRCVGRKGNEMVVWEWPSDEAKETYQQRMRHVEAKEGHVFVWR